MVFVLVLQQYSFEYRYCSYQSVHSKPKLGPDSKNKHRIVWNFRNVFDVLFFSSQIRETTKILKKSIMQRLRKKRKIAVVRRLVDYFPTKNMHDYKLLFYAITRYVIFFFM